jgi:plasmid stabilization system protein ParE
MTAGLFTPRAERELRRRAAWIAEDNPDAAEGLLTAAIAAAKLVTQKPALARVERRLAPVRYRFWSLRAYPYLLVVDTGSDPPVVARFVHQSRDLPAVLDDL